MLEIQLKTLTPLWTGGVDQQPDRLHETGLIGSLRWWYEALVRGLGGYACDPTGDDRCPVDDKHCAVCELFGCTGWARLFRLRVGDLPQSKPLHFYTTANMNKAWLRRIFRLDGTTVPFGTYRLLLSGRGQDEEYARRQIAWTLNVASRYGGLGAKLQHGFGQVSLETDLGAIFAGSEGELKRRIEDRQFRHSANNNDWPDWTRFFWRMYHIRAGDTVLQRIRARHNLIGQASTGNFPAYIPCVFDLRYKGEMEDKQLGFRRWLINKKWSRKQIADLMGETQARRDEDRMASRLSMSMPWLDGERGYVIKVFGFAPPNLEIDRITTDLDAYMDHLFSSKPDGGGQGWTTEPI